MKTKVSQIPKGEMVFIPGMNDWGGELADSLRDVLLFALCTWCSSKASSRPRKERYSGKMETPEVSMSSWHRGDAGGGAAGAAASGLWGVCPACPKLGHCHGICPGSHGKHHLKLCSWQEGKGGDHAQHTEEHLSSVFQWVGPQILKFSPWLCVWNCLLCQPLHSCASIAQQDPPPFPAGIRNAQECFKQRLVTVLETSISLSGYLLGVALILVKTAVLGIS